MARSSCAWPWLTAEARSGSDGMGRGEDVSHRVNAESELENLGV
ncbi:MAG: hypothetical protein ACYSO1_10190 [Planctomycetota bacterium]